MRRVELIDFLSKTAWEKLMRDVENLRNRLAHSNDFNPDAWAETTRTAEQAEALLQRLEKETNGKT